MYSMNWQCLYCSFSLELLVWQRHGTLYNNFLGCYHRYRHLQENVDQIWRLSIREKSMKSQTDWRSFLSALLERNPDGSDSCNDCQHEEEERWSRWISAVQIKQWIVYNPILKADVPRPTDSLFHTQHYAKHFIIIKVIWPCPQSKAAGQRTNFLQNTVIKITSKKKLVMNFALRLFQGCFQGPVPKFSEKYL